MIDAILGLVIATIATSALALAVEFTEASFARKDYLDDGLSKYELAVLEAAGLDSDQKIDAFKSFLGTIDLYE